jgi:hypothetical protein
MVPFNIDPLWYERYWWHDAPRRSSMLPARAFAAASRAGAFAKAALWFVGYVLFLIVAGDFRLPRCKDAIGCRHESLQRQQKFQTPDHVPKPGVWE